MKIRTVTILRENLDLARPYTIAYKTITAVENIFLLLQLEDGTTGIGCAAPSASVTGETIDACEHALRHTAEPLLHGADIRQLPALVARLGPLLAAAPAALAAVDVALHDAFTQHLGIRLIDWWGGIYRALPTSITIGITSVEDTVAQAREHLANGFQVFKLKTGRSVPEDVEVFTRLRETVGPDALIRVDANQGYQPHDLVAFARATQGLGVEFYEQPFPAGHLRGMVQAADQLTGTAAQLATDEDLRRLCAADEDLHHATDALALAAPPQPFGIFNVKLMKCGGPTEAGRIAFVAERVGIDLMWGCNDESRVSIAAALHRALSCRATRYLDLDGSLDLARDLVSGGFELHGGLLYPTDAPGLGVKML